jgi:hypothetical protein
MADESKVVGAQFTPYVTETVGLFTDTFYESFHIGLVVCHLKKLYHETDVAFHVDAMTARSFCFRLLDLDVYCLGKDGILEFVASSSRYYVVGIVIIVQDVGYDMINITS